jgi:beta-glucosidase
MVAVDRDDGFRRVPRPSAHAFARVARTGDLARLRVGPG